MAKRSSSSMEVLLGLLTIESMSGYDLGQTIKTSVGYFWNESYGQIYPNLKRLAAAGLVTAKVERQKGKPERRIYSLTAKGRERLEKWLAIPPQPEIHRNELLLKLFFGTQAAPGALIGYVKRMAENEGSFLRSLKEIERDIDKNQQYPAAPYWKMVAHFGEMEIRAHLQWAEETVRELNKLARKQAKEKSHAGK